jgi:hypothetical protein
MDGDYDDGAIIMPGVPADWFDAETGQPIFEDRLSNVIPFPRPRIRRSQAERALLDRLTEIEFDERGDQPPPSDGGAA